MALRAPWEQRYLFGLQTSGITNVLSFDAISVLAEADGKPLLKCTNNPFDLDAGRIFIDQRKATGQSTRFIGANKTRSEFQISGGIPVVTPEMDCTPNIMKLIWWLQLQKGASEAVGTPFLATYVPYASGEAGLEVWATILDLLSTSTAGENQAIHGCVVRSWTLSGDMTSQVMKLSFELVGASHVTTYDASSSLVVDPDIAPLLFKDMVVEIDANAVNVSSISITMTNNVFSPLYSQATPFKHVLNGLDCSIEMTVPRDSNYSTVDDNVFIADWKAVVDRTVEVYWGSSPAVNDQSMAIIINGIHVSQPSRVADGELGHTISLINADDATNDISLTVADAIDRAIP